MISAMTKRVKKAIKGIDYLSAKGDNYTKCVTVKCSTEESAKQVCEALDKAGIKSVFFGHYLNLEFWAIGVEAPEAVDGQLSASTC